MTTLPGRVDDHLIPWEQLIAGHYPYASHVEQLQAALQAANARAEDHAQARAAADEELAAARAELRRLTGQTGGTP